MWAYRNAPGDPQLTFNYVKALSDYLTNFCFGKGVGFTTPEETAAIVPYLLRRVWHTDNVAEKILWETGNLGSVSGDVFVKVAYEQPYVNPVGMPVAGKVRIMPINPAQMFPEWHPHDRTRLIRLKMKYRFWATDIAGTRQIYTYTELLTENSIEEYVNDELIDARPNPLGEIPVVHIANLNLSSSPWGLSDIQDIIGLNREYNEKATDISDIINYHAAPVTVITGAKASQLEKGAKKVWAGLPKDAKVFNLESDMPNPLQGPMEYLDMIKRTMHEFTGVPEGALGQMQPISNTSGVSQAMTHLPTMNRRQQKLMQYSPGVQKINRLVLKTLALHEPWTMEFNPVLAQGVPPTQKQYAVLDPNDDITFQTFCNWPEPLPFDVLVKLNEIQAKMAIGLESKRGALRDLGEEQPDQKLQQIFEERIQDLMEDGALALRRTEINMAQQALTGTALDPATGQVLMPGDPHPVDSDHNDANAEGSGPAVGVMPTPIVNPDPEVNMLANELNTMAYGTKLAQPGRKPDPSKPDN